MNTVYGEYSINIESNEKSPLNRSAMTEKQIKLLYQKKKKKFKSSLQFVGKASLKQRHSNIQR